MVTPAEYEALLEKMGRLAIASLREQEPMHEECKILLE